LSIFETAVEVAPRIRTPVQLAGFLFALFCGAVMYRVVPENVGSLTVAGAVGVAFVVIPLTFRPEILNLISIGQRGVFLLAMLALLLTAFGALAYVTAPLLWTPTAKGAKFDSELRKNVQFIKLDNARSRAYLEWELFPTTKDSKEGATVFAGIVVLHDEAKTSDGIGTATEKSCEETPSCIGSYVFEDFAMRPVFVRGGAERVVLRTPVDFRGFPKTIRVWWEFYQREGDANGLRCGVDHERGGPKQGLPPLAMYDSQNKKVGDICYSSADQVSIPVVYQ